MAVDFNKAFGIHAQALSLRGKRASILASNLANADTPGYKAKDLDFNKALKQMMTSNSLASLNTTNSNHITNANGSINNDFILYRNPLQPSLDKNTVDSHVEQAKFSENALQYQTSMRFLNGRIRTLISAIKGE